LSLPANGTSGKAYRGINVVLTMLTAWERGYSSNVWVTFKQHVGFRGRREQGPERRRHPCRAERQGRPGSDPYHLLEDGEPHGDGRRHGQRG
jgi:hypothetical protein